MATSGVSNRVIDGIKSNADWVTAPEAYSYRVKVPPADQAIHLTSAPMQGVFTVFDNVPGPKRQIQLLDWAALRYANEAEEVATVTEAASLQAQYADVFKQYAGNMVLAHLHTQEEQKHLVWTRLGDDNLAVRRNGVAQLVTDPVQDLSTLPAGWGESFAAAADYGASAGVVPIAAGDRLMIYTSDLLGVRNESAEHHAAILAALSVEDGMDAIASVANIAYAMGRGAVVLAEV